MSGRVGLFLRSAQLGQCEAELGWRRAPSWLVGVGPTVDLAGLALFFFLFPSPFPDRVESLGSPSYVPSFSDLLHVRARTVGIVQGRIAVPIPAGSATAAPGEPAPSLLPLCLVDVGGQRPERRHWFHALDHVACVVFVASVADFDQTLAEDRRRSNAPTLSSSDSSCAGGGRAVADGDSAVAASPVSPCDDDPWLTNRMQDSLTLFTEVCSSHFFRHTDIVLLLVRLLLRHCRPLMDALANAVPSTKGLTC